MIAIDVTEIWHCKPFSAFAKIPEALGTCFQRVGWSHGAGGMLNPMRYRVCGLSVYRLIGYLQEGHPSEGITWNSRAKHLLDIVEAVERA